MSKNLNRSIALAAAVGMFGAYAAADTADAGAGLTCEIRMVKSGDDIQVKGLIHAASAASGSYKFRLSQNGDGGSSRINQGGDFSLAAGESSVVGEATMNGGDGLVARLSVSSPAGSTSCTR